jgi:uncharacterized protein
MPAPPIDVYSVPIGERHLIYAPLHHLAALVDDCGIEQLRAGLEGGGTVQPAVAPILERLRSPGAPPPERRQGDLADPLFLGLIPTRGCHLGCSYCDFGALPSGKPVMTLGLARDAIDAYTELLASRGRTAAQVHFFGGEPFDAEEVVHFAVDYARRRAADLGLTVHFEVTTNGAYSTPRCEWIADNFDVVVLSLDGPSEIQDKQRPTFAGGASSPVVNRSARILSDGSCELMLRACVTQDSVGRMEEIASWISREFVPSAVCFETLVSTPRSDAAGLAPPDPWEFARHFLAAARLLARAGIDSLVSTVDLGSCRAYVCPVGRDALIVSPDGGIDACYLPRDSWHGLNLRLGEIRHGQLDVSAPALQRARGLSVLDKRLCADCLCRFHCAGGCPVGHDTNRAPGEYDDMCIQTRLVTFGRLLERIGRHETVDEWLADRPALEASVRRPSDRLCDGTGPP